MGDNNYPLNTMPYYGVQQPYMQQSVPNMNVYPSAQQAQTRGVLNVVRTVYSEPEARAAQIPTDGSTIFFLDQNNGRIYTKQFSFENGSFLFRVYTQQAEQSPIRYATIGDLEKLREELTAGKGKNNDE